MPKAELRVCGPLPADDYDLALHCGPGGAMRALFQGKSHAAVAELGRCSFVRGFREDCCPSPVLALVDFDWWQGRGDGCNLHTGRQPGAAGAVRSVAHDECLLVETVSEAPPELSVRKFPTVPAPEPVEVDGTAVTFAPSCGGAAPLFDDADAALAELARAAVARNLEPGAFEAFEAEAGGRRVGCWAARERDGSALRVGGIVPV